MSAGKRMILFWKSHISGYVRRSGAFVRQHERGRHPAVAAARTAKRLGGKLIASAIQPDIVPVRGVNLVGHAAGSIENLALLCQAFRNPEYETFRVFYERDGRIVGQLGISARRPGTTPFPTGFEDEVRAHVQRLSADKLWLVHNHPSGDPRPSIGDMRATERLSEQLPLLAGHIIINSGKYSCWRRGGEWQENIPLLNVAEHYLWEDGSGLQLYDFYEQRAHPMSYLMRNTHDDPALLASVAKGLQRRGRVVLASVAGSEFRIRSLTEVSVGDVSDPGEIRDAQWDASEIIEQRRIARLMLIRLLSMQTGATNGAYAFCDPENFERLQWLYRAAVVRDVLALQGDGSLRRMSREIDEEDVGGHFKSLGLNPAQSKIVERFFDGDREWWK